MSSELERLLRDAREALPGPDDAATVRARRRAVAPPRSEPRPSAHPRSRRSDPRGSDRARSHAPDPSPRRRAPQLASRQRSASSPSPVGSRCSHRHPWCRVNRRSRLRRTFRSLATTPSMGSSSRRVSRTPRSCGLPPKGIVVVASMTSDAPPHLAPVLANPMYPEAKLPLRFRDGASYLQSGAQVRPDQPLAQLQLRARIRPLRRRRRRLLRRVGSNRGAARCRSAPARRARDPAGKPTAARGTGVMPKPLLRSPSSTTHTCATRRCSVACTSSRIVRMRGFVQDPDGRSSRMWSQEVGDGPPR